MQTCKTCEKTIEDDMTVWLWQQWEEDGGGAFCESCAEQLVKGGEYGYDRSEGTYVCFVCDKPILGTDINDRHWCHEPGCSKENYEEHGCYCDLECCAGCCPVCSGNNPEGYGHLDDDGDEE